MEVLSAAASGMTVVTVAVQLAEGFKKLCDFWNSMKDAPEDIRAISADLKTLSNLLIQIAHEAQHDEPDTTLITALNGCSVKVKALNKILNEIEPGFSSTKSRVRQWTAFKAGVKRGKLTKFQMALDRIKVTLLQVQVHQNG